MSTVITIKTKVYDSHTVFFVQNEQGQEVRCANATIYHNPPKGEGERFNLGSSGWVGKRELKAKIEVLNAMLEAYE